MSGQAARPAQAVPARAVPVRTNPRQLRPGVVVSGARPGIGSAYDPASSYPTDRADPRSELAAGAREPSRRTLSAGFNRPVGVPARRSAVTKASLVRPAVVPEPSVPRPQPAAPRPQPTASRPEPAGAATVGGAHARPLVIGCGALANELVALTRRAGFPAVDLTCLPAALHNRPERIPGAVRTRIRRARAAGRDQLFVAYADCGTGGLLDRVLEEEGVARLEGAHCYEVYAGRAAFAALSDEEPGTFYLTDFLARNFDRLVIRGLGLDRHPELLEAYFGNYRRVVYLAQTDNTDLTTRARRGARRLGLRFERRFVGYGELAPAITSVGAMGATATAAPATAPTHAAHAGPAHAAPAGPAHAAPAAPAHAAPAPAPAHAAATAPASAQAAIAGAS